MNNEALVRFWAILNYENMNRTTEGEDSISTYAQAMQDYDYHPISETKCMIYAKEHAGSWYLLLASGSSIIKVIDCGDMKGLKIKVQS